MISGPCKGTAGERLRSLSAGWVHAPEKIRALPGAPFRRDPRSVERKVRTERQETPVKQNHAGRSCRAAACCRRQPRSPFFFPVSFLPLRKGERQLRMLMDSHRTGQKAVPHYPEFLRDEDRPGSNPSPFRRSPFRGKPERRRPGRQCRPGRKNSQILRPLCSRLPYRGGSG